MQNLNLIDKEKSSIKYEIIEFSDGESHIKFTTEINRKDRIQVLCRVSSMRDLFILMQVGDILNRMEMEWALVITYLIGMRMDRVINFNEAYTLKKVAEIINNVHPDQVYVVEPHSEKTLTLIKNCLPIENNYIDIITGEGNTVNDNYILVFPDAGAKLRYNKDNISFPVITCKKKRDLNTGALSGFEIENPEIIESLPDNESYTFLVLDDLCDGGGTFCGISDLLAKVAPDFKRVLAVTHAVNIKGIVKVLNYYNQLYITNSYKDWENDDLVKSLDNVKVLKVEETFFNM